MPTKYGLTTTTNTAKTARATVGRWNDGVKRHTVYTVCGTTADGWGLTNRPTDPAELQGLLGLAKLVTGNNALTVNDLPQDGEPSPDWAVSFDTAVGRAANPNLFNWVPVSYPAAATGLGLKASLENNWQPASMSMAQSAKAGVDELIRLIKTTPGTFALVGMSQGSVVITQVLKALLPGGALANRYHDCIAGIAFGNPCRAPGASFPGGTAAFGAGVISSPNPANSMTGGLTGIKTPDWWWEMSITGDFFSSAPLNSITAPLISPAIQGIFQFPGGLAVDSTSLSILLGLMVGAGGALALVLAALVRGNVYNATQIAGFFASREAKGFLSAVAQRQQASAVGQVAQWIYEQVGVLNIGESLRTLSPVITPSNVYPNGNPHIRYGVDKPPTLPTGLAGVDSNSTYVDVALAYLNARGAAIAPR